MLFWIGILLYVIVALPFMMIVGAAIRRGMQRDEYED